MVLQAHQLHIHKRPAVSPAELRALLPWRPGDLAVIIIGKEVAIRPASIAALTRDLGELVLARSGAVPAWLVPELARADCWDSIMWIGHKSRRLRPHFTVLEVPWL